MAGNKRKNSNGTQKEDNSRKDEFVEDKETKIGNGNETVADNVEKNDDDESSDSSVYSELDGKHKINGNGPINLLSDRLLRYVLIFEYQILVLDLVVDIRTKISEGI